MSCASDKNILTEEKRRELFETENLENIFVADFVVRHP